MLRIPVVLTMTALGPTLAVGAGAEDRGRSRKVELGARPRHLVEDMDEGRLKRALQQCREDDARVTDFSIGHRGACLGFPEHTRESYEAAARMGAGVVECDVTFTRDRELVCRHSPCDLHTTTNILATPLAGKCTRGFAPARHDDAGNLLSPASARCCTSDITLAEFRALEGRMDVVDESALTVEGYLSATPEPVAGVPTGGRPPTGTLMTHAESIALFSSLGVRMTPELKAPSVDMPFHGFAQEDFAQKMIDEYEAAGVPAREVFAQSFSLDDILYWIEKEPAGPVSIPRTPAPGRRPWSSSSTGTSASSRRPCGCCSGPGTAAWSRRPMPVAPGPRASTSSPGPSSDPDPSRTGAVSTTGR